MFAEKTCQGAVALNNMRYKEAHEVIGTIIFGEFFSSFLL